MKWASALSRDVDALPAVERGLAVLREELRGARPDLLLAFVSSAFTDDAQVISERLRAEFPAARIIGCSGGGVIGGGHEAEDVPAISLTAARLPDVRLTTFHLRDGEPSDLPDDTVATILLADPFSSEPASIVDHLDERYPSMIKIGGLASGGVAPGAHCLWLDDQVHGSGAVGVALTGALRVETLVAQGCRPFGPPMFATRVDGHLLVEVDNRAPLEVLKQLHDAAGEDERRRMRHSLFVGVEMKTTRVEATGEYLVRNIVGVDPSRGALAVGAVLEPFQVVQFMLRDAQAAEEELTARLSSARLADASPPAGALLFSCTGRGRYLFGREDHDTGLFAATFGPTPLGGFFCNGEIGPVGGKTWLHGYTSAFALFRPL